MEFGGLFMGFSSEERGEEEEKSDWWRERERERERERVKCVLMWVVRKKRKKKKNDYLKKRECIIDNMMYVFL